MSMKVPAGDPFGVGIARQTTDAIGLVEIDQPQYSELNAAKGLERSAAQIEKSAEQWRNEQENLRFTDKINAAKAFQMELENDPETGYKAQKGKNALERPNGKTLQQEYGERWDEFVSSESLDGLSPSNRKRYIQYMDASKNSFLNGLNQHVVAQSKVYRQSVDKNSVDLAMRMALSSNEQDIQDGMYAIKSIVDRRANEEGVEPDYTGNLGKVEINRILLDIDDGNIDSATTRLKSSQYMSTSDRLRAKRSLQIAKSKAQSATGSSFLAQVYKQVYSPKNMAIMSAKEVTGKDYTEIDYKNALALANGNEERAVQILAFGVDRYEQLLDEDDAKGIETDEEAILSRDKNANSAYDKYQSNMGPNPSLGVIVDKIRKLHPDIDEVTATNAARKAQIARRKVVQAQQADRDQRSTIALATLRQNNPFESLPQSLTTGLNQKTLTSLKEFERRRDAGSLVTNSSIYWDLLADEGRLKKLSDEDLIQYSAELSEKDFDEISSYREGLKTGKYKNVRGVQTRRAIKDAMARNGLTGSHDENQKAAYGFVLRAIEDRVLQEIALAGKDLSTEEVGNIASKVLATEFAIDENWGGVERKRVSKVVSSGGFSTDSYIDEVLDAGLEASGIDNPTKTNRTELLLSIGLTPNRPLPGAEAMVSIIQETNPYFLNGLYKAYASAHGGATPEPTYVVRAYLNYRGLFK